MAAAAQRAGVAPADECFVGCGMGGVGVGELELADGGGFAVDEFGEGDADWARDPAVDAVEGFDHVVAWSPACRGVGGDGGEPGAGSGNGFAPGPQRGQCESFRFEGLAFAEVDLQAAAVALQRALHRGGGVAAVGQGVKRLGGETVVPAMLHDQVDVRGVQCAPCVRAEDEDLVDEVQRPASLLQPVEHVVQEHGGALAFHGRPPLVDSDAGASSLWFQPVCRGMAGAREMIMLRVPV